jgi:hypothetical protein
MPVSSNRLASIEAVKAFLQSRSVTLSEVPWYGSAETLSPRAPYQLVIRCANGSRLALDIAARKVKPGDRWFYTTHNYLDVSRLNALLEAGERGIVRPYLLFVLRGVGRDFPIEHDGRQYRFCAARPEDYLLHSEDRSPTGWDKLQVPSVAFQAITLDLETLLRGQQGTGEAHQ